MNLSLSYNTIARFLLLCNVLLVVTKGESQEMPKVIPPSPEVSALFKYLDYPVDHSTGVPQVNIPIYEIKSGSLSVPISLSYHASGRKVNDQDGPVAVGWSLNAGGMISRTIYGSADFGTASFNTYYFPNPYKTGNIHRFNDLKYLERIMHSEQTGITASESVTRTSFLDAEYDVFSYVFNNNSGKFVFKDNNNIKTPALLPYKPYIITPHYSISGLSGIDIIDDKGVTYIFTASETYGWSNDNAKSGFALQRMISADKTDVIDFEYQSFNETRTTISQSVTLIDAWSMSSEPSPSQPLSGTEHTTQDLYQIARLKTIIFKQGKVVFNLTTGTDKISTIQILNQNNEALKTIEINRTAGDQFLFGISPTNKLGSVVFKDKTGSSIENYSFEYYPTMLPPNQAAINVRHCDYWGYYNASGVEGMVPYYNNIAYSNPGASNQISLGDLYSNREPNLEAAKSGVLKKIHYPTGGSTEFTYEANKYYTYSGAQLLIKNGPGLRVSQIQYNTENEPAKITSFKYGTNESGYGSIELLPSVITMASELNYSYYNFTTLEPNRGGTYRERIFFSGFIPELSALAERPIIYTQVVQYHGTEVNNNGKTVYDYDYAPWSSAGMQAFEPLAIPKLHISNYNYWNNPSLIAQTDYKANKSGAGISYKISRQVTNNYLVNNIETVKGLHVQRVHACPQTGLIGNQYVEQFVSELGGAGGPHFDIYTHNEFQIPVGIKNLNSSSETRYNDNNSTITTTTSYTYNSRKLLSATTQTTSDQNSLTTDLKYPFDFPTDELLTQMSSPQVNMLNYVVEEINKKNLAPLSSVKTTYYNWNTSQPLIAPLLVEAKKGANNYEPRLRYYSYDLLNGNPLSISKDLDIKTTFLWDYKKAYPVAEVINADLNDIAYTSFEAEENGNWAGVNGSYIQSEPSKVAGLKSYQLNNSTISKGGLSVSKTYVLNYWSKSSSAYSVSGVAKTGWPKNLRTVSINGVTWYYWEHRLSAASGTIQIGGNGTVDELRLYPEEAQMTTYTYEPLIGISSKADLNGRVTYYEYDAYSRLKLIRDMYGNIIKQFSYKYKVPLQ